MPLGKISSNQIKKAFNILSDLSDVNIKISKNLHLIKLKLISKILLIIVGRKNRKSSCQIC